MRFFRRNRPAAQPEAIPFVSTDLPYVKHHALLALCGLLMDRHSRCEVCPFCGDPNPKMELIVRVDGQEDARTGESIVALYISKVADIGNVDLPTINDWAARVRFGEPTPNRKVVVSLLSDDTYRAEYGSIANPTEGDYSTGILDRTSGTLTFRSVPKPTYAQWQYWESEITADQQDVPEYLCLRANQQWWVVDRDLERHMVQQVAGLEVADNPNHPIRRLADSYTY